MIPKTMDNYFLASTGASAALVRLIFVAISLWPREKVGGAPPNWLAVGGGSFFALFNVFFISLNALNPGLNLGWPVLMLCLLGIVNSVFSVYLLQDTFSEERTSPAILANRLMIFTSLAVYAAEGYFGNAC